MNFKLENIVQDLTANDLKVQASLFFAVNVYAFAIRNVDHDCKKISPLVLDKFDFLLKVL